MKKLWCACLALSLVFTAFLSPAQAETNENYKLYVMAPLKKIADWEDFKKKLDQLKENGVYALTTDIWWGLVEGEGDNQFDWSYYRKYAEVVEDSGLKWVPILSTHQCGGNVGDQCDYPIPAWLWNKDKIENMAFKSESGYINQESLAPWWKGTEKQYDELYKSFAHHFVDKRELIVKIYLSGGPAGEIRYPSYQGGDNWEYPERGKLQAYSEGAERDFQKAMRKKYTTLKNVNNAWGKKLRSWEDIKPPNNGDSFFTTGEVYHSQYGKDFMMWYQGALEQHLSKIAKAAHKRFDPLFNVPIGAKISGVHWKMNDPVMPHSAEYSAGYYNYAKLLAQFKASRLALTFTCLEMKDSQAYESP
ncbi:family 14 glycosylhydrolase [Priestia endophytica]|uniref:family 14 glycosylhydrolase n=1 Tax=Priestia endophytica TaxID=135735 RepID=UPI00227E7E49|nr:family 14 glycosylhydrolase [Priestia endophytica]